MNHNTEARRAGNSLLIKAAALGGDAPVQDILIKDGRIARISADLPAGGGIAVLDAGGRLLLPGFIDLHTHGAVGVDMNDLTLEGLVKVGRFFASQGVTGYLPTLLTDTRERLLECLTVIAQGAKQLRDGAAILGVHLEGPFLCAAYKGAMPEHLLRLPSLAEVEEYQQVSGGLIRRITVSPELPGMPEFIRAVSRMGISVSLGHTGADYDTTWECIRAGACCATHTFNAMLLPHQHAPAVSGALLESDCYCEAICDGLHLHPGMVRLLLKTKGWDKVIGVTDSIMAAGLGDGAFYLGVNEIVVKDGDARLKDGSSRAGSTLTMLKALHNLAAYTQKPLHEVAGLLAGNPAALLGLPYRKGAVQPGLDADLVLLDADNQVATTIVAGAPVYQRERL